MLKDGDIAHLKDLLELVRYQILPLATSASDVCGIGESWEAIELWIENNQDQVEVNVEVGVFCREGDPNDSLEHLHCDVRIDEETIVLSTLRRTYTKEHGSDHHSEVVAQLGKNKSFNAAQVEEWMSLFAEVMSHEAPRVSVSRDHL